MASDARGLQTLAYRPLGPRTYDKTYPPPKCVRGRRRQARLWLDMVTVLCQDPPLSERIPEDGWKTHAEMLWIWKTAHDRLRERDLELFRVVERLEWEERKAGDLLLKTPKKWFARFDQKAPRIRRVRAMMRRTMGFVVVGSGGSGRRG